MTTRSRSSPSLAALNMEIHAHLDEALLSALDAVTALDLETARRRWRQVEQALAAHAQLEDRLVLPLYARSGPAPRGGSLEIMAGEHTRLATLSREAGAALDALRPGPALRRTVVTSLDTLLRPRHLLDHHTEREQRLIYPTLESRLTPAQCALVAGGLQTSLAQVRALLM